MAAGGGGHSVPPKKSWADVLGSSLPPSWSKNVLELSLEKDEKGPFSVGEGDCAKLMSKLGMAADGGLVEAVQICPNGRGVIFITLKNNVSLEKFLISDIIQVTQAGVRVVHIKPAGKREVIVTLRGLHPNVKDQSVLDYLSKFGKVITTRVVHCTFSEGPLKGLKNGDRSFKLEIKPGTNIGTYHVLFGQKVTLRYQGQKQTCARCYESSQSCIGGGIAKKCEAAGGQKVDFSDHILKMWRNIGYTPEDLEVATVYDDHGQNDDLISETEGLITGATFTPPKTVSDPENFDGISLRNFPKEADHGDIMEFLIKSGLPTDVKEKVYIKPYGTDNIDNIDNMLCQQLINKLHQVKFCDRKIFCRGIISLTPQRNVQAASDQEACDQNSTLRSDNASVNNTSVIHTPSCSFLPALERRKSVRDMVTDFSSCLSNLSSSEEENVGDWSEAGGRRQKKSKRKPSSSPPQDQLAKKVTKV